MKTCGKCGIEKDASGFSIDKGKKDGRCAHCKMCSAEKTRAWNAANKDRKKSSTAAWEKENKERLKEARSAYHAARYAANPKKILERNASYRAAHKEQTRLSSAKWRQENKDRIRLRMKKWNDENPDNTRIKAHNYRARKAASGGKLSKDLADRLYRLQRGKCACGCGQSLERKYHLDHIMPLALGGTNTDDNIQLLRDVCNWQKHSKHPIEFMQQRGFLI